MQRIDRTLARDAEIVLAAVRQDGLALEFANVKHRRNPNIAMAAVCQNCWARRSDHPTCTCESLTVSPTRA